MFPSTKPAQREGRWRGGEEEDQMRKGETEEIGERLVRVRDSALVGVGCRW